MGFFHKVRPSFLRRVLFQLHLWTGLATGLYVVVVCSTGAGLVFRIDVQRAMHPNLFTPSAPGPPVDAATIMARVRDRYPADRLSGVDAPTTTRPTYLAYVVRGERFLTVLADPVTGAVLGELPEDAVVRTVQDLHFDLLGGRTGRAVNGVGAAGLLLMCLTGFVIWWQGAEWRRGLTVDLRRSWRRVNWDVHSAVGIWALVLIAMWAVTGFYFAFPNAVRDAVNRVSPITVSQTPRSNPAGAGLDAQPSWRTLIASASERVPGAFVARVVVPASIRGAFLVQFSDVTPAPAGSTSLTSIYLDQYTGAVLEAPSRPGRTAGDVVMAWLAPLHVGNFGGFGVRVVWAILGLAPPLLFGTGFAMWWTRVVRVRYRAGAP